MKFRASVRRIGPPPPTPGALTAGFDDAVDEAAHLWRTLMQRAIETGPKTGRVYRAPTDVAFTTRGGKAVAFRAYAKSTRPSHQASAPGEAPASDIGQLVNSINVEHRARFSRDLSMVPYGQALEYGTARIAPRPFIVPQKRFVRALLRRRLVDVMRGRRQR